jgi:hypothetical protein
MGLNQRHKQTLRELLHDQPTRTLDAFFARVDGPQQDGQAKPSDEACQPAGSTCGDEKMGGGVLHLQNAGERFIRRGGG